MKIAEKKDNTGSPQAARSPKDSSRRTATGSLQAEQTQCRFCRRGDKYIDYKDVETLQRLLTNRGKIYSRKRSGNCAGCQRKVKRAIKRARYMALLPFTA
jgi:small subunit ribosomal protein S18